MEIKENHYFSAGERNSLVDKTLEMMKEINDPKRPNVLTEFGIGYEEEPRYHLGLPYVLVPKDIIHNLIARFKENGWYAFDNNTTIEIHRRKLGYDGHYL